MMAKPSADITNTELSVMEVLWQSPGGATVREIVLALYGRHEHSLHGGVKSFLDRLMEKGYVEVDKTVYAHRFSATVSRSEFVGRQLKRLADEHYEGALTPMLLSLVKQAKLSSSDRDTIERIIENIEE